MWVTKLGNYWTIGTLEMADTEVVQITGGSASPWTIMGVGNNETTSTGFKFGHAILAAATEAENVGALVLIGKESLAKLYSSITGPAGKSGVKKPDTIIADRFTDFYWTGLWGYGRIGEGKLVRAEFPAPAGHLGFTEVLP